MSRKSFQRVTLSVELTLPPGAKAGKAPIFLADAIDQWALACRGKSPYAGLAEKQTIIKIIKRETIYTN